MSFIRRATPVLPAAVLVLGLAACEPDLAPPFEPEGTGSIAGRLFFDADEDGLFTPTRGDTLLVGVPVEVRERGTEAVLDETETTADGRFQFADVRVGTHDVYVVATPEEIGAVVLCENPVPASVYRNDEAFVTAPGKVACVIDIAEAKNLALDAPVVVVGTVIAAPGTYRSDNLYIQDETGGIQAFGVNAPDAQVGDVIEVSGSVGTFETELQITGSPRVEEVGTAAIPAARVVTAGALGGVSDPKDPLVGVLATVRAVAVGAFTSGGGRNADITDATGTAQLRLDGNALDAIGTAAFVTGTCYDITGVVGIFRGATQLKPRSLADVTAVSCP